MDYHKRNFVFLVCDFATNGVLLVTKDLVLANSLSVGVINTYIKAFSPENSNPTVLMLLNNINKHYYIKDANLLDEMLPSSVSQDLRDRKVLIQRRKNLMAHWVEICKVTYERQLFSIDSSVDYILDTELSKSAVEPTTIIHELAGIMEVGTQSFIDDAKMRLESIRAVKLRINTVFEKYRNILNSLKDSKELQQAYKNGITELITNAYI